MNEAHARAALLFVMTGMRVLSARAVLLLTLLLVFGLFVWSMVDPTWPRIAAATIFAVLVFWPVVSIDRRQASDRAAISPTE